MSPRPRSLSAPGARRPRGARGFSLPALLVAFWLGLLFSGVVLHLLLVEGDQGVRLARLSRERLGQKRALALIRADVRRAIQLRLEAAALPSACPMSGRRPVLQLRTAEVPPTPEGRPRRRSGAVGFCCVAAPPSTSTESRAQGTPRIAFCSMALLPLDFAPSRRGRGCCGCGWSRGWRGRGALSSASPLRSESRAPRKPPRGHPSPLAPPTANGLPEALAPGLTGWNGRWFWPPTEPLWCRVAG